MLPKTDLIASTPNIRTDIGILMKEFQRVRSNGYAIIDQELEIGLCSIAAPLECDRGRSLRPSISVLQQPLCRRQRWSSTVYPPLRDATRSS